MLDPTIERLLAFNPRTIRLRAEIASRVDASPAAEVDWICIDGMETNLAMLCVLFFQRAPRATRLVKSSMNDLFVVVILFLEVIQERWRQSQGSSDERACLETVADLFSCIGAKRGQRLDAVKRELIGAYFLCLALKNGRHGRPPLEGVRYDVFVHDELCASLLARTSMREVVTEVRHQVLQAA